MSTVATIKEAIEKLSLSERGQLAKWFNGWEDDEWDAQMAKDFAPEGRYSDVAARVKSEIKTQSLRDLP